MLDLAIDASWTYGLVLAITRVAAFVVASPLLSTSVPLPGRLAVIVTLGFFLASPITVGDLPGLLVAAVVNATVGATLGYLTGVLFQLFAVAGSLIDLSSGLSVAALVDPSMGQQAAVFSRLFNLLAVTLFVTIGGLELLVRGLVGSVTAIPLDGRIDPGAALAQQSLELLGRLMVAAIELALPVIAALFLTELVLGLAARFAPQANIFLLGLPVKLLVTLTVAGAVLVFFPGDLDGVLRALQHTFVATLNGLAG